MILIFWLDFEIDELYLNASSLTEKSDFDTDLVAVEIAKQ